MKIDPKHKIPLTGEYNANIHHCPECGEDICGNTHKHIIGFAEIGADIVAVVECPNCFLKWWFHARTYEESGGYYGRFLWAIKFNEQLHYSTPPQAK